MKSSPINKSKHFFVSTLLIPLLLILFTTNGYSENFFKKISSSLNIKGEKDLKQAELMFAQKNYIQAADLYKKYLDKNKDRVFPELNYKLGVCYFETENYEASFPFIEKAYNFKQHDLEYQLLYAECLITLKQTEEGISIYKKIIKDHPKDYLSHIRLGELLVGMGKLTEAREYWLESIKIDSTKTEAYSLLAESYLKVENNKLEAYYYTRKMYEIASNDKKEEASLILKRISGKFSNDFENQYILRMCIEEAKDYSKQKNYEKAYNSLMKCNHLTDINDTYLILFANTCELLKKHKEAAISYEKCIAIGYEKGEYYYNAALNYLKIGKIDTAIVLLKKALSFKETRDLAETELKQLKIKR